MTVRIEDIHKIADIHKTHVSDNLINALIGQHTYLDTKATLREHLYCPGCILEENDEAAAEDKLPTYVLSELKNIHAELTLVDCTYFRLIS